jgi:two-component system NtrC family sensor kinase
LGPHDGADRDEGAEALRRRLEDYERWFRVLDSQIKVLERERQKLSAVVNHTDAGFILLDPSLRVLWTSDVFARSYHSAEQPASAVGEPCSRVLCGRSETCPTCPARQVFQNGSVAHHEIRLEVDGRPRHIYATAMPIKSPEGRVDQTIVMVQDISDLEVLRRSREALRASEERLRSIFENAAAGMARVGPDGSFLQVNPALCRFLGYAEAELLALTVCDVTGQEDLAETRRVFVEAQAGRPGPVDVEKRYVRKDGAVVWGRTTASWLLDGRGRPTYAVSLVQDVTDRKRLEEELRQAEKMSAVGLLVSGVAHELNNPLAGVLGYAQLLLASSLSGETTRRGLETILREAERCKRIVQNLQTFARKRRPQEEPVDVNEILESTLELHSYQLKVDDIDVEADLDPSLPRILGDAHQLRQVFLNIILNAHQAMAGREGGGRLAVASRRRAGAVVVEIEDSGPGIPAEHLSRIFDPFFTTKEVGQGTGLGLSICYGIVEEHRGRISARDVPGGGARFTVELPIGRDHAAAGEPEAGASREGPGRAPAAPAAGGPQLPAAERRASRGGRILVVDDEPTILEVLDMALSADGHAVDAVLSASEALRRTRETSYDLIITDLKMPGMDGEAFYERVRESDPSLAGRIVFSTGDTVGGDTRVFLEKTGNRYWQKPFDLETVKAAVREALDEASLHARPAGSG